MPSAYIRSKMKSYMDTPAILEELKTMQEDKTYRTVPGYSIDAATYPDNVVPFIDEHINYLKKHPQVDPQHYLSNLRLMLKVR